MNLQNLSVIFIIIAIPIILVTSYYISLQTDTIKMQTSYDSKLISSAKEAIKAFETNTVEWNEELSKTADSKRRDVMASINTFTTSFANNTGMTGATKESILPYIPAIAFTLYDGYYIYSPSEIKEVIKDENGISVFMTKDLSENSNKINGYTYADGDEGKIMYEYEADEAKQPPKGTYIYDNNGVTKSKEFTLNPDDAKSTYSHILKPFIPYSARYNPGNIDIVINYTLDNYITIYGTIDGGRNSIIKSGYLEANLPDANPYEVETLKERIVWKREDEENYTEDEYVYVYAEDNTKVYFDGDTTFSVSPNNIRTDLTEKTGITYKKLAIESDGGYGYVYQALVSWDLNKDNIIDEEKEIKQGNWYKTKGDPKTKIDNMGVIIKNDVSAINYYIETKEFNKWVEANLGSLKAENIQIPKDVNSSEIKATGNIFGKYDKESVFNEHKREVIKQTMINNLNQAITSYSRNSKVEGEFKLPKLTETDWDQIVNNVSIIAFMQEIPIGMKYYNNYIIATSTLNKEYVNPDEIYLSAEGDDYYHMPYCQELQGDNIIGYRNTDYAIKSYYPDENNKDDIMYYYRHKDLAYQECYYCLVQRDLYKKSTGDKLKAEETAYKTALARERYNNRITMMDTVEPQITQPAPDPDPEPNPNPDPEPNPNPIPDPPKQLNITIKIDPSDTGWQSNIKQYPESDLYLTYDIQGDYTTKILYKDKNGEDYQYEGKKKIEKPKFSTTSTMLPVKYDVKIETIDNNGNLYEGNVKFVARYIWNGRLNEYAKYRRTLQFDNSIFENVSENKVTLNLK